MGRGIRSKDWNYGGRRWKLSRSKIDLFLECPRCFYLDNKLGIRRPGMPSFNLNSAVDALLKKEFDIHRKNQTPHNLFEKFGINAVPYQHPKIDTWRENFEGVLHRDHVHGLTISGAIDDLWQLSDGTVAVVDYKSTAKDKLDMTSKWIQNYYRQLEVYQWLLQNNDVNVSDKAYILYANGDLLADQFGGKITFKMSLHEHVGDTRWIEPVIDKIANLLKSDQIPDPSPECEHCEYHDMQNGLVKQVYPTDQCQTPSMTPTAISKDTASPDSSSKTLFD